MGARGGRGGTQQAAPENNSQRKTPKISNTKNSNCTDCLGNHSQTSQLQLVASVRQRLMDPMSRKRNASDGDSGFDSALSSRSSSISLDQEPPDFGKQFFAPADYEACDYAANLLTSKLNNSLRETFLDILNKDEDIEQDEDELLLITNRVTGSETLFKPPSRLTFCKSQPQVANTHSSEDYDRNNAIPRNHLFHDRLEYEREKQIDKMDLVEVDLVMETGLSPPPSLGIRVIGVNMIHGVPDKLNIYVKRVVEDSVAGCDGRIRINDHIVEVNGISLVGVSQKLAAQTLSNCAICPETGKVHFVLARSPRDVAENSEEKKDDVATIAEVAEVIPAEVAEVIKSDIWDNEEPVSKVKVKEPLVKGSTSTDIVRNFTQAPDSFLKAQTEPEFVGRDAVRLIQKTENEERSRDKSEVVKNVETLRKMLRLSKITVLVASFILVSAIVTVAESPKRKMT